MAIKGHAESPGRQLGGRGVLRGVEKRRGGGEDPWLCGPGFHRVCPSIMTEARTSLQIGTNPVKQRSTFERGSPPGQVRLAVRAAMRASAASQPASKG